MCPKTVRCITLFEAMGHSARDNYNARQRKKLREAEDAGCCAPRGFIRYQDPSAEVCTVDNDIIVNDASQNLRELTFKSDFVPSTL